MAPRAGKTKAALDAIAIQRLRGYPIFKVLVVCPISALSVWEEELETHFPLPYYAEDPEYILREDPDAQVSFQLINYDLLRYRSRDKKRWVYPYRQAMEEWSPDLVILDESHRAKRAGAVTSQALWKLVQHLRKVKAPFPWVYLLTGTPNPKGYLDLFAQYRVMDDTIFGTNVGDFKERYIQYGMGRRRFTVVGYNNKDELLKKLQAHCIVVPERKIEGMPGRVWQNIKVPLPHNARRVYEELADELVAEWEGGTITAANAGALRIRLRQLTGGFLPDGTRIHEDKLSRLRDLAMDLHSQEEPLVVYARFLPEVSAVREVLEGLRMDVVEVTGATTSKDRTAARRRFQAGSLEALVFQVSTGSLAINLSRANEIVYYSLPDGWLDYYQSSKRTAVVGKGTPTRIRHLVCPNTIDIRGLQTLRHRADEHAEFMQDARAYLFGG